MSLRSLAAGFIAFIFIFSSAAPTRAFAGSTPQTEVILIQDAHSDEGTQLGIEKLLREITTREKIDFIALEGAWTRLTPEVLEFSGKEETNQNILLHLLKHGEISGADLFAVSNKSKYVFEGVEDKEIYKKYFNILRSVLGQHEKAEAFSKSLRQHLMDQSSRELNPKLRDFIRQQEQYIEGSLSPLAYLEILKKLYREEFGPELTALQNQIEYPNTLRILALKKQIVSKEAEAEYKKFRTFAGPGNLRGIVEAVWDKQGSFPFSENLKSALRFHILEEELAGTGLFTEIDAISEKLLGKLARAEKEKTFLQEWKNARLLSKLLKLEISPEDWGIIKETFFYHSEIDSLYQQARAFYSGAQLRDQAMTKNLIRLINSRRAEKVVLITGGFHTAAIQKLLHSSGIQTRVMTPEREIKETEGFSQLAGKNSLAQYRDSILHTSIALPQIATMAKPNAAQPVAELFEVDPAGVSAIGHRVREAMSAGKSLGTKSKLSLRAKKPVIDIEDLEDLPLFRIKEGQKTTEQFRVHQHAELNNNLDQLAVILNTGETAEGMYMIYHGRQGEKFEKYEIGFFLKTSKFPNGTALSIVHERKKDGVVLVRGALYAKGAATNRVYSPLTKTKEMLNEKILEEKIKMEMVKAEIGKKLGAKTNGRSLGENPIRVSNPEAVRKIAKQFFLMEKNEYAMALEEWDLMRIAKENHTEAELLDFFTAIQQVRTLARETGYVVGNGFHATPDALQEWSEKLRAKKFSVDELRGIFQEMAAVQPLGKPKFTSGSSLGAVQNTASQIADGLIDPKIAARSPAQAGMLITKLAEDAAATLRDRIEGKFSSISPLNLTVKILMPIVRAPEKRPVLNIFTSDQLTEDTVNLVRYLRWLNSTERTVIAVTVPIPKEMVSRISAIENVHIIKPEKIGDHIEAFKKEFPASDVHKTITVTAPRFILDSLFNFSGINFITPVAENAAFKTASARERIGALLAERSAAHLLAYHRGDITAFEKLGLGGILTPASGHTEFAPRYDLNWSVIASSLGKLVDEWRGIEAMRRSA